MGPGTRRRLATRSSESFDPVQPGCLLPFNQPYIELGHLVPPPRLGLQWTGFPALIHVAFSCRVCNFCPCRKLPCRLELSPKILNTLQRLRTTLSHEMCHVAAWLLDQEWKAPHGPAFWRW